MPNLLFKSNAPRATILIRLLVGAVFLSEGIQKFLFPATLGVGRFLKIGIPAPQFFAPFVGIVEIVCGILLVIGLLTISENPVRNMSPTTDTPTITPDRDVERDRDTSGSHILPALRLVAPQGRPLGL
jgi:hypothetical protein